MFDILGQDGYTLHKEITRMDSICNKIETSDLNQYQCDVGLKKILERMFRAPLQQVVSKMSFVEDVANVDQKHETPNQHDSNYESAVAPMSQPASNGIAAAAPLAASRKRLKSLETYDDKPTRSPFLGGGGIAAAGAEAARKREKVTDSDSKPEVTAKANDTSGSPSFLCGGGIAAAAAEAARKRERALIDDSKHQETSKEHESPVRHPPFVGGGGIAAVAAEAARKREKAIDDNCKPEETVKENDSPMLAPPFFNGGGIAAAAAEAARKRANASKDDSNPDTSMKDDYSSVRPPPFLGGGGIAAAATEAARKREKALIDDSKHQETAKEHESPVRHPPFVGGGIAAVAAEAARKRERAIDDKCKPEETVKENDSSMLAPPFFNGGGIAAAAAEAARKRANASNDESNPETSMKDDYSSVRPPPFLGGGGIAAAAAEAARKREKALIDDSKHQETAKEHESPVRHPPFVGGGGIAATAAEAARKRENATEVDSKPEETASENDSSGYHPFLVGAGIAAAAVETARKREMASIGYSKPKDTAKENDFSVLPPPLFGGGSIAAAAAEAARKREKASKDNIKPEDPSAGNDIGWGTNALGGESLSEMLNPVASALDDALNDFHVALSKSDDMGLKGTDWARPSLKSGAGIEAVPAGCTILSARAAEIARFSEKDVIQGLVLEALKDSSQHSRRISTLYCASSLCFFVASMMTHLVEQYASISGQHQNDDSNPSVKTLPSLIDDVVPAEDVPGTIPVNPVPNVQPIDAIVDGVSDIRMGGEGRILSNEQEEKKDAHEEVPSPFGGIAAAAAAAALMREKKPSEDVKEVTNGENGNSAAPLSVARRREGKPDALPSVAVTKGTDSSPDAVEPESKNEAIRPVRSPPIDLALLVEMGGKALLRGLTIANQASSQGMIGWLEYGSSNFLDRTASRPLDILEKLAYQHAMRKEWQVSIDILRTRVLRCERHLPLYHPVTLSSMLDLAAACSSASERNLARSIFIQVSERLSFYLTEQESVFIKFHTSLQTGDDGGDVSFQPLTGADHISMLQSFASLFEELIGRDFLQGFGDDNEVLLVNHCLVGDSYSVLANCVRLSETGRVGRKLSASCISDAYWSAACQHYRLAFEGWTRKGYELSHPNVSAVACSVARCLRELGETDKATRILTSVVSATSGVSSDNEELLTPGDTPEDTDNVALPVISFLPRGISPALLKSTGVAEISKALNLWYLAAYAVESNQDERGRIRALSLLHASSEALERALNENEKIEEALASDYCLEMLQCVEDEARELFAPLDVIEEDQRQIEVLDEDSDDEVKPTAAEQKISNKRVPYPSRKRSHRTGTKANFLPSAFA